MKHTAKLLLSITTLMVLTACGEDTDIIPIYSKYPDRTTDVVLTLNEAESDMEVCNEVGYTDTINLNDQNEYSFRDYDKVNNIRIFIDFYNYDRTNTIIEEYSTHAEYPQLRHSMSYRVFYHHQLKQLLINEGCVYDLTKGEL